MGSIPAEKAVALEVLGLDMTGTGADTCVETASDRDPNTTAADSESTAFGIEQ